MINPAALHLAVNHFPIAILLAAVIVLAIGMARRSDLLVRTAAVLIVVAAVLGFIAFRSGEPAEHLVEPLEGINDVAIHPHEEAGEKAIWGVGITGVVALVMLIAYRRRDLPPWAPVALLVLVLISIGLLAWTGYLGGKIHHPETMM